VTIGVLGSVHKPNCSSVMAKAIALVF